MTDSEPVSPEQIAAIRERSRVDYQFYDAYQKPRKDVKLLLQTLAERDQKLEHVRGQRNEHQREIVRLERRIAELEQSDALSRKMLLDAAERETGLSAPTYEEILRRVMERKQ